MEASPMTMAATTTSQNEDSAVPTQATLRPSSRGPNLASKSYQKTDKKNLEYIVKSGLAGGIAGCAAKSLIAPLDRVKILFQASNPHFVKYTGSWFGVIQAIRDIKHTEGRRGLYKGHSATLIRIFPYAAIKFVAYEQFRAILIKSKEQETPLRRLLSGSLAGVTSVFFTYPLEVIRVQMAYETRKERPSGFKDIVRQIYYENGVHGSTPVTKVAEATPRPIKGIANLYRGFVPTVLGMIPYAGVSFLTHDLIGDVLRSPAFLPYSAAPESLQSKAYYSDPSRKIILRPWAELMSGGLAGMAAQTASYPLEVIRRRMQVGGAVNGGKHMGILDTARIIYRTNGVRGFFVGLSIGYVKVIPMTATAFFVYERMKVLLGI